MKKILLTVLLFSGILFANAQSLSPKVIASSGGFYTSGGVTLSWTLGETFTTTLSSPNNILTQGFQQPYIKVTILNISAFIEGFYLGGGLMRPVLYNAFPGTHTNTDCDSVTIELHQTTSPYALSFSAKGIIDVNGDVEFELPSDVA